MVRFGANAERAKDRFARFVCVVPLRFVNRHGIVYVHLCGVAWRGGAAFATLHAKSGHSRTIPTEERNCFPGRDVYEGERNRKVWIQAETCLTEPAAGCTGVNVIPGTRHDPSRGQQRVVLGIVRPARIVPLRRHVGFPPGDTAVHERKGVW
jgi:hypothetical protein